MLGARVVKSEIKSKKEVLIAYLNFASTGRTRDSISDGRRPTDTGGGWLFSVAGDWGVKLKNGRVYLTSGEERGRETNGGPAVLPRGDDGDIKQESAGQSKGSGQTAAGMVVSDFIPGRNGRICSKGRKDYRQKVGVL